MYKQKAKMKQNKILKGSRGITLIALVITIIVLLILAAVSIATLTGENGILTQATRAGEETNNATEKEQIGLAYNAAMADNDGKGVTQSYFETELKKYDNGITVTEDEENNNFKVLFPSGNEYTVKNNGVIETGKNDGNGGSNGVAVDQIFDSNGKNETDEGYDETKLHIGDFINYDAGSWTQQEIDNIQVGSNDSLVTANGSEDLPNTGFQFGGFKEGTSKNGNATPYSSTYKYVKENREAITGWRLFDVNTDGSIVLISAGCPEDYNHPGNAYISEYILSGNDNSTDMNLEETYTKRNWDNYVNEDQKAISAEALTKSRLEDWYTRYMERSEDLYDSDDAFQSVYGTKYETIVDNYSYYWLCSANYSSYVCYVNPDYRYVDTSRGSALGVRALVTLSSEVKLSKTSVTKTITDPRDGEKSWTYNIWNIE